MAQTRRQWTPDQKDAVLKEWFAARTPAERMSVLDKFSVYRSVVQGWINKKHESAAANGRSVSTKGKKPTIRTKPRSAARPARKVGPQTALMIPRNGDPEATESASDLEAENRALKGLLQLAVHRGFLTSLLGV